MTIPPFEDAVAQMRAHLASSGAPQSIEWVFRDDLVATSPSRLYVIWPPHEASGALAGKVCAEGASRGLVEIIALGTAHARTLTSVWFPKFPGEEVQGWDVGMKLGIRDPLPQAVVIPRWLAPVVRFTPAYRRFNTFKDGFIGDRAWAEADSP